MYNTVILPLIFMVILLLPAAGNAADISECRKQFYGQQASAYSICLAYVNNQETVEPEAHRILASMYYWGWGDVLQQNYKEAMLWYKRAAGKGDTEAKFAIGVLYEQGKGTAGNYEKSLKWFTTAANDGHIIAQFNLGNMFAKGAGTRPNQQLAVKWYKRAAEQGDALSAYNLANRYAKGEGIGSNLIQAYKWYLIAQKTLNGDEINISIDLISQQMGQSDIAKAELAFERWTPKREHK